MIHRKSKKRPRIGIDKSALTHGVTSRQEDDSYLKAFNGLPCLVCHTDGAMACHVRIGHEGGTGLKPDDDLVLPLCDLCHGRFDGRYTDARARSYRQDGKSLWHPAVWLAVHIGPLFGAAIARPGQIGTEMPALEWVNTVLKPWLRACRQAWIRSGRPKRLHPHHFRHPVTGIQRHHTGDSPCPASSSSPTTTTIASTTRPNRHAAISLAISATLFVIAGAPKSDSPGARK